MGDWYEVIKTINGRKYRYRQRTWKEDGKVRTQSYSLGAVDPLYRKRTRMNKIVMALVGNRTEDDQLYDSALNRYKAKRAAAREAQKKGAGEHGKLARAASPETLGGQASQPDTPAAAPTPNPSESSSPTQ